MATAQDPILNAITWGAFDATASIRNAYSGIPPTVPDQINLGLHSPAGISLSNRESIAKEFLALEVRAQTLDLRSYSLFGKTITPTIPEAIAAQQSARVALAQMQT